MLDTALTAWSPRMLSVLRIVAALIFFEVGTMKILHFPQPAMEGELPTLILIAGWMELVGGFLLLVGLLVRPVAFVLSGQMAAAFFIGHAWELGSLDPGVNFGQGAILYCFIFLYLVFAGGGPWSLDAALARRRE
jgi:putative oxidoreductase